MVEMIVGPTPEPAVEVQRVRGRCLKDNKFGWATLSAFKDTDKTDKFLVCAVTTAMRNAFGIKESKAVRKVEIGEVLVQLEEPKEDTSHKLVRVRVKARRDSLEGWVTMTGNQGTAFVSEATTSHRECKCATPLQATIASDSKEVRMLEESELFEVQQTKTEKKEGALLAKGRNISNATEGWFASNSASFARWSPAYTCVRSADLKDGVEDSAKVLRALEVGESLCALRPPVRSENGTFSVHVQADKDGLVGFAIVNEVQEGTKPGRLILKSTLKAA